jgi:hypothetical protein
MAGKNRPAQIIKLLFALLAAITPAFLMAMIPAFRLKLSPLLFGSLVFCGVPIYNKNNRLTSFPEVGGIDFGHDI